MSHVWPALTEEFTPMPIVVVATMKAKPESVDAVRDACKQAIEAVHLSLIHI